MSTGLKNRGRTKGDVEERRKAVEDFSRARLECIAAYSFDPTLARKNIENMIGFVQVPLGFVGPLRVNGDHAVGEFLIPMATTEGALVASVNRGCSVLTSAGGVNASVVKDQMTRAPVFRVRDMRHGIEVVDWVRENENGIRRRAESTTGHGKLVDIKPFSVGRNLYLRFAYETGDAMGMNMATIATEAASRYIEEETGAVLISVSGNVCVDKKAAAIDFIMGRGKMVLVDALVPGDVVEERLRASVEAVVETGMRKNSIGSAIALSYGFNAHIANILAAVYIATGQDPAQVVEGSMGVTTVERVGGDLYIALRLPAIEVGTVGGGTRLPCQSEALSIMDCLGEGRSKKLAEIIGAACLAGELSTLAAQAAGHLSSAHASLGR